MRKDRFITAIAVIVAASFAYARQPDAKVTIQVNKVPAVSGQQMYASYCASCHGVNGKGNGPVAPALKMQPIDLTTLSKNNNGKFPGGHITSVLENGSPVTSHGSATMPVWGPILGNMDQANGADRPLRISNLCRYLESIQEK